MSCFNFTIIGYRVPQQLPTLVSSDAVASEIPVPTELPGDGMAHFTADFSETNEEDKKIDYGQDHNETHHLFGKAIRIPYEYGWKFGCSNLVQFKNWETSSAI